jgi:hypothetical protein
MTTVQLVFSLLVMAALVAIHVDFVKVSLVSNRT